MVTTMFLLDLFGWWYGAGWAGVLTSNRRRLAALADMFSTKILLRTLFAPWRRIITVPGASLDAHIRALVDNLVSRLIGFSIRAFVLFAGCIAFIFLAVGTLLELIVWPLVPIAGLGLIVKGLL